MSHRQSPELPLSVAILLVGGVTLAAFTLLPGVIAQEELSLEDSGGAFDTGGFFDSVGIGDMPLGLQLTLAVAAVGAAAALAFMGGTKFVNARNVLENDARRSIFEYIRKHPGVHLRAAASALDLSTTNVLWHLRKLESAKLVSSKKFEGYKVFYPVEGGVQSRNRAIGSAVLRNENAQQILECILAQPSSHQREIARVLGVNHGTVRWHLRKLVDANLVEAERDGSSTSYFVTDLGVKLLADHGVQRAKAHLAGARLAPGAQHHPTIDGPPRPAHALDPHAHHTLGTTPRASASTWADDGDDE